MWPIGHLFFVLCVMSVNLFLQENVTVARSSRVCLTTSVLITHWFAMVLPTVLIGRMRWTVVSVDWFAPFIRHSWDAARALYGLFCPIVRHSWYAARALYALFCPILRHSWYAPRALHDLIQHSNLSFLAVKQI